MAKEPTIRGEVVETLPNLEFRVLIGENTVRCYMAGKLRMNKIRLLIGDKVDVVLPAGSAVGRVVRRV